MSVFGMLTLARTWGVATPPPQVVFLSWTPHLLEIERLNIVLIHKKGSRKLPENYRSVSLLPLFGKIMERCVYDTLLTHVQPPLSPRQHRFLPRRSCDTNLATLLKTAWESLSSGHQTADVKYTDYSAAFQSVQPQTFALQT